MHPIAERFQAIHLAPASVKEIDSYLRNVGHEDIHLAAWMVGKTAIGDLPNPFPAGTAEALTWESTLAKSRQHRNVTMSARVRPTYRGVLIRNPL
jgi:thermostable 8-oxoguanine DNA glycosylase